MTGTLHQVVVAAVAAAGVWSAACAPRPAEQRDGDLRPCLWVPAANYLAAHAQQCWYITPQGRWRIVNYEFHYDVLVVETEASSVDLADEITRRLTDAHGQRFSEILIYVRPAGPASSSPPAIRRVQWIRGRGVAHFDFAAVRAR